MIGETLSHYRILSLLGEGGMGMVYLAEDVRLGRRVAVKIPHAAPAEHNSYHARFLREARSISALSHPNIATLFDYGETSDGKPYIVMELVEGRELTDLLAGEGLTIQRALEIVEDVAEALGEAHRRGIIHRDIKPSNVIVNERGEVKVLDFGLAKLVGVEHDATGVTPEAKTMQRLQTRSDVMLGTPLYLSPEQAKGKDVDARSDLFALGALLYECVAGRPAFAGATVVEIAAQVLHVTPPPPSKFNPAVPRALDRVVCKALAKDPAARYQSADEFAEALAEARLKVSSAGNGHARTQRLALDAAQSGTSHQSALVTLSDNLRRPRVSLVAVGAAVALALVGFWGLSRWWRPSAHKPSPEAAKLFDRGVDFMRDGAYWQASKALARAVEEDDKYALAHARLAEAWTELDYLDKANYELVRVAQLVPDRTVLPERERLYLDAVTSTATRDFAQARKAYEEIARQTPKEAYVYVDLGRACEKAEDAKCAGDNYVMATQLDSTYATAYLRVGTLYTRQQEYQSAASAFEKAESIYANTGVAEGRAEVLYRRGYMLRAVGKNSEARAQLQQSLDLSLANGYETQQINALLQLSAVASNENDAKGAQGYAREAFGLAQAKGMENLVALSLVDLGTTYYAHGEHAEAEKYLKQGLDFAERNHAQRVRAKALINLGGVYIQQGKADEGVRYVEQALAFYQPGGYRQEAQRALAMLARANRQKGNYAEALRILEQQLDLADKAGDPAQVALAHAEIGNVLVKQEDYPGALRHFGESHRIEKASGNELRIGYSLINLGEVQSALGRYPDARDMFEQAAAIAEKSGVKNKELTAYLRLAQARAALVGGVLADAKTRSAQVLELVGGQNLGMTAEAKIGLALAQARAGAGAVGSQSCREAIDLAKSLGDSWLFSNAQLAYAETLLESGDTQGALTNALDARESFARSGQRESEWRAWALAARSAARAGRADDARQYAAHAAACLGELQRAWGEAFDTYQARPDVQQWRKQLGELPGARPA
jgi:tetratricopeptide (TPR) repeat protein/predicted Ser/Thr protein kinase